MKAEAQDYREVTILLVDDDELDVKGIKRALSKLRILNPVIHARDGEEALELLRDPGAVSRPYIILLDINMPRMNGLEMLAELRNDPMLSSAIVFVLTTSKSDEDKVKSYEKNIAGYMVKSEVGDDFMRVVEMLDQYWRVVELPLNT